MATLTPYDSTTAIKVLNTKLAETDADLSQAKQSAISASNRVSSLDKTVNGTLLLDIDGNPIPETDEYGNAIYDEWGNVIFKRVGDGIVMTKLDVSLINADQGAFKKIIADNIDAEEITAKVIDSDVIKSRFADIDLANVKNLVGEQLDVLKANIGTLLSSVGLISTAVISEGHVTGYLDSVQINANSIKAGTLDVERLIITDEQGQKHLIHYNESGEAVSEKLDGNIIEDKTITADKLVAHSITSNEITTENIIGSGGWINLASATFNFSNADTGHGISWDGFNLSIRGGLTVSSITDFESAVADKTKDLATKGSVEAITDRIKSTDTTKAYSKAVPSDANYSRIKKILGETIDNFEHRNYIPNSREEVTLTNTALQTSAFHNFTAPTSGLSAMRGQNITVSFEVRINEPLTVGTTNAWFGINYSIYHDGTTRTYARNLSSRLVGPVGQWVKVTNTQPVADVNIVQIRDLQYLFRDIKGSVSIRNAKIEVGSTATMWTPAPEDGLLIDATPTNVTSVGRNLYNVNAPNICMGWINNGTIVSSPANALVYVPIERGKTYSVRGVTRYSATTTMCSLLPSMDIGSQVVRQQSITSTSTFTFTAQENENYLALYVGANSDVTGYGSLENAIRETTKGLQIEIGSSATDYSPYTTNSLNVNYGTLRSAGTVHDELDLVNGKIIRRVGQVDLGTLAWIWQSTWASWYADFDGEIKRDEFTRSYINGISGKYAIECQQNLTTNNGLTNVIAPNISNSPTLRLFCKTTSQTEKPTGTLNYELAEPIEEEINVTGTLLPVEEGGTITFNNMGDDYGLQVPLSSTNEWWYLASSVRMDSFDSSVDARIDNTTSAIRDSISDLETDIDQSFADVTDTTDRLTSQYGQVSSQLAKELVSMGYATIENGVLTLGNSNNNIKAKLSNTKLSFTDGSGSEVAYIGQASDGVWAYYITRGVIEDDLRFGNFQWIKRNNGNMSLKYIGGV